MNCCWKFLKKKNHLRNDIFDITKENRFYSHGKAKAAKRMKMKNQGKRIRRKVIHGIGQEPISMY
jgi:hypothetical protein